MRAMFVRQMLGVLIVNSVVTLSAADLLGNACDGKTVPNGVVKCLEEEDNSCFLSCDYGFSAIENHKYDCNLASAISDPSSPQQDDCGCAENMAFVVGK